MNFCGADWFKIKAIEQSIFLWYFFFYVNLSSSLSGMFSVWEKKKKNLCAIKRLKKTKDQDLVKYFENKLR